MKQADIRASVEAWSGVSSDVKWGDNLVFSVAGKMFCAMDASGVGGLGFKVEPERFLELTDRPGIVPAPYLARAHWVRIADVESVLASELSALIRRSYELVRARLPKKVQRELAD